MDEMGAPEVIQAFVYSILLGRKGVTVEINPT